MIYSKASKSDHRGDLNEKGYPGVRYDLSKSQLPFYYPHHKGYGRSQRRFCNRYLGMERYLVLAGVSLLLFFLWFSLTYTSPTLKIYNRKASLGDPLATLNTSHLGQQLPFQGRAMKGTHGGVAVEAQECADVGTGSKWTVYLAVGSVLKQGGTAVDAAIASALCIGVLHGFATGKCILSVMYYTNSTLSPFVPGIGGGGFMLVRTHNGTYEFIDFRDQAPQGSYQDMFVENPALTNSGGLSIGIPGDIRGFELAHKRHGALPWAQLFPPAIKLARHGFRTTQYLYEKLVLCESWILKSPEFKPIYAPTGNIAQTGDILKRPALANTLEAIAKGGADAYYTGPIAESIVRAIQNAGGIITMQDLRDYRPKIRPTINTYYHGKKVTTASAPTSGPVLISMLNILERYNLATLGRIGLNIHRLVETMKFGYAFRTELADPDFQPHLKDRHEEIISKEWASRVRAKISDTDTHPPAYYGPKYEGVENHGTMHMSVVDENDGVVAMTTTLNHLFGSQVMDPVSGVIFNNGMDDFSIPGTPNFFGYKPSMQNYVAPGKRSQSSITPVIVESDGRFFMALGGSGGSQIPSAVVSVLTNVLDYNMELYEAVATPRIHHQLMPNTVGIETTVPINVTNALKERRHELYYLDRNINLSGVQTVRRLDDGTVHAVSEPRKYALASAY
ncbi:hypothetical protein [Absidia glauca]|uniref:Glutathione hydrolase n=1 Tax=Absidia glauca TaxID=4829 RepID=A0A168PJK8_ABSGL|nr:hypothetical protein [Absidia glauca]